MKPVIRCAAYHFRHRPVGRYCMKTQQYLCPSCHAGAHFDPTRGDPADPGGVDEHEASACLYGMTSAEYTAKLEADEAERQREHAAFEKAGLSWPP